MCTMNEDDMMYGSWYVRCNGAFYHFGPFFPYDPPNNPKRQNFEKMKKLPGYIIILHQCIINNNHMIYGS